LVLPQACLLASSTNLVRTEQSAIVLQEHPLYLPETSSRHLAFYNVYRPPLVLFLTFGSVCTQVSSHLVFEVGCTSGPEAGGSGIVGSGRDSWAKNELEERANECPWQSNPARWYLSKARLQGRYVNVKRVLRHTQAELETHLKLRFNIPGLRATSSSTRGITMGPL